MKELISENNNLPAIKNNQSIVHSPVTNIVIAGFFDAQGFELLQRISSAFSKSELVPKEYRGNMPNCMIAIDIASRIKASPLMVMQNLYIVHGNPSFSSKFLIATINSCGRYTSLKYEWRGKQGDSNWGCRAYSSEKGSDEKLYGSWVDWKMVEQEGWSKRANTKWLAMPEQMFMYRASAFWQRAYAPELTMGINTVEEAEETIINVTPEHKIETQIEHKIEEKAEIIQDLKQQFTSDSKSEPKLSKAEPKLKLENERSYEPKLDPKLDPKIEIKVGKVIINDEPGDEDYELSFEE
jgi:hypothetical protein